APSGRGPGRAGHPCRSPGISSPGLRGFSTRPGRRRSPPPRLAGPGGDDGELLVHRWTSAQGGAARPMSTGPDDDRKPRAATSLLQWLASVSRRLATRPLSSVFRSVERMHSPLVRSARFESLQSQGGLALVRDGEETFVVFTSDQIISRTLYVRGNRFFDRM